MHSLLCSMLQPRWVHPMMCMHPRSPGLRLLRHALHQRLLAPWLGAARRQLLQSLQQVRSQVRRLLASLVDGIVRDRPGYTLLLPRGTHRVGASGGLPGPHLYCPRPNLAPLSCISKSATPGQPYSLLHLTI